MTQSHEQRCNYAAHTVSINVSAV